MLHPNSGYITFWTDNPGKLKAYLMNRYHPWGYYNLFLTANSQAFHRN